jgi:hypothetical protein
MVNCVSLVPMTVHDLWQPADGIGPVCDIDVDVTTGAIVIGTANLAYIKILYFGSIYNDSKM